MVVISISLYPLSHYYRRDGARCAERGLPRHEVLRELGDQPDGRPAGEVEAAGHRAAQEHLRPTLHAQLMVLTTTTAEKDCDAVTALCPFGHFAPADPI